MTLFKLQIILGNELESLVKGEVDTKRFNIMSVKERDKNYEYDRLG